MNFETTQISDLILLKNNQFIAFNKPPGLPVQSDKSGDKSLLDLGEIFCRSTLYLVHRLDRAASGVAVLAKTKSAMTHISEQFHKGTVRKTYLAVVGNAPPEEEGTLVHYLLKNEKDNRSKAFPKMVAHAQEATLHYRVLAHSDRYHLLEIELLTGRHHQIRAQLAAIGCPIKGDVKYGFRRGNKDRSIHLHSWKIAFDHPVSGERVEITAPLPDDPLWKAFFNG